jgi:hypothetical protein
MKFALAILLASPMAFAGPKEECLDAHGRGQDLRERGQLKGAKKAFLSCAQSQCPSIVQSDCAKLGEEIDRMLPTVSFGARDGRGGDLPVTSVWVDGLQVATRLDDGKLHELDPGSHTIRFTHDGKEVTQTVVMTQGEKGRFVAATFRDETDPRASLASAPPAMKEESSRSVFPLVVAGVGAAALATGGILLGVGFQQIPSQCAFSTHDCAAPPGDPAFGKAQSGVNLANAGVGIGIGGLVVLAGGIVWYFLQPKGDRAQRVGGATRGSIGGRQPPVGVAITF